MSRAYGPKATPHVFIFDEQRKLRYEGRIDNSQRESLVKTQDARNAHRRAARGQAGAGGSHGRVRVLDQMEIEACMPRGRDEEDHDRARLGSAGHRRRTQETAREYNGQSVAGEFLGDVVRTVRRRVSGPQETCRMYRGRDFDFVSVSTNLPDEKPGVIKALQKLHASNRNLQFASDDTYAMQAAFDAKWESGVPYTVLMAPGGKVLYEKQGELDMLELRRIILGYLPDPDYIGHRAYWAAATQ